jgi:hypothetical protein
MKRMLLAAGAIALIGPATEASAQYRYNDRQTLVRQGYNRPIVDRTARASIANAIAARTTGEAVKKPAVQAPKPAPAAPLTAEQLAAKAAVDELFAREPALAAAKERPDPRLAREAAAKHNAQEKTLATLRAKEEAAAAKRRERADKIKARDDAKAAAITAKQQAQSKDKLANADVSRTRPSGHRPAIAVAAGPARPMLRMPTP